MDLLAGKPASFYAATGGKPVEGAWYGSQRYMGGQLLAPGQDQPGHDVSQEVIAQTNPGNVAYVNQQRQNASMPAAPQTAQPQPIQNDTGNPAFGSTGNISMQQPAVPDINSLYAKAIPPEELAKLNKNVTDQQAAIDAETAIYNESKQKERNNPMYSASVLSGKLAAVDAAYNENQQTKLQKLQSAKDALTMRKADAESQVNIALKQYDLNSQASQQAFSMLKSIIDMGGNLSGSDIASFTQSTGLSSSFIQSAVKTAQAKNTPTSLIQYDDGVNQGYKLINTQTGDIIKSQVVAASKPTASGANAKPGSAEYAVARQAATMQDIRSKLNSYGDLPPEAWINILADYKQAGGSREDFIKNFGDYADTNRGDFEKVYGFKNPTTAD